MFIPHTDLSPATLDALIEDFASRDGTDYGDTEVSLEDKKQQIMTMLDNGRLVISFDPDTASCALHSRP